MIVQKVVTVKINGKETTIDKNQKSTLTISSDGTITKNNKNNGKSSHVFSKIVTTAVVELLWFPATIK